MAAHGINCIGVSIQGLGNATGTAPHPEMGSYGTGPDDRGVRFYYWSWSRSSPCCWRRFCPVQAARDAGRRTQWVNNLKQFGLVIVQYESDRLPQGPSVDYIEVRIIGPAERMPRTPRCRSVIDAQQRLAHAPRRACRDAETELLFDRTGWGGLTLLLAGHAGGQAQG